jgi:hypothetical protein
MSRERRTCARAQILSRRESEGSQVLGSPDPVVSELEISWASGECVAVGVAL